MHKTTELHTLVFHTLEEQIAVIDQAGNIIDVNLAWLDFGHDNGISHKYTCIGLNYLKTLGDSAISGDNLAAVAFEGITDVLERRRAVFYFEYPCHTPNEKRWFTMRVSPLHGDKFENHFVISHHNITERKLAEEQIEKLAMQDPLTGLSNRRTFQQYLKREIRLSSRNQAPMSLVLIDADYFKNYNDNLGHAAGDKCLISFGQVLLTHARRPNDLAARIGGDEFALVLGNTKSDAAIDIAESILISINDLNLHFDNSSKVTASIGVFTLIPKNQHNEDFIFHEADKALYRAKKAGRNQVVHLTI